MPAVVALRPVALRRVALLFAAITLRWLHDDGERALFNRDLGVWAQSLPAPGGRGSSVTTTLLPSMHARLHSRRLVRWLVQAF